jgi:hypothetical protein
MNKITITLALTAVGVLGGWYVTTEGEATARNDSDAASFRTVEVTRRDIGSTVLATGGSGSPRWFACIWNPRTARHNRR